MTLKEAINAIPNATAVIATLTAGPKQLPMTSPLVVAQQKLIAAANKRIIEILNQSDTPLCVMSDDGSHVIFPSLQPAGVAGYQGWTSVSAILSN